ncbi:Peptidyl-Lys metalloendopeptidase, partial [Leucoagaricus sp. SymC.cos]
FEAHNLFSLADDPAKITILHADVETHTTGVSGKLRVARANFVGRSASQQSSANANAIPATQRYAANAFSYISSGTSATPLYMAWFGTYTSARQGVVWSISSHINSNDLSSFTYDCTCPEGGPGIVAYVYPNDFGHIYLCSIFWLLPITGTDSRISLIWRLRIIWTQSSYAVFIVTLPTIAFCGFVGSGTCLLAVSAMGKAMPVKIVTAYASFDLATDLLVTLLIVARIMAVRRQAKLTNHSSAGAQYTNVIAILVESFALSSSWDIAEIITSTALKNAHGQSIYDFLAGSESYIRIISYLLIVCRVTTGRAWREDTKQTLTSLHFNRGPQITTERESRDIPTSGEFESGNHGPTEQV